MLHKDMDSKQRERAEKRFRQSTEFTIELFTKEPYIELDDGTRFYIDVISMDGE